jgi:LacI family gluconate utilization system Gnt-I transcriptional repressor
VQLWELPSDPIDMAIGIDNDAAGVVVARHFYERGYRRYAVLGHQAAGDTRSSARIAGFGRETRRLGLTEPYRNDYVRPTDMTQAPALLAWLRALTPAPDAVFCVGAPMAIGMVLAARRLGVAIPGDLAIAAFGDNDLAPLIMPALTTISIPRYAFGQRAGDMLLQRFAGQTLPDKIVDLGFHLIIGETT